MVKTSVNVEKMQSSVVTYVGKVITAIKEIIMDKLLLNVDEVAELFSVKVGTVKSWVSRKQIPQDVIFKIGTGKGTIRFKKSKLEDWINGSLQEQ